MKLVDLTLKLKDIFMSRPTIGGLEISHSGLRFILIQSSSSLFQAALRLPPGIIEQGRVKDIKNLIAALKDLHGQIAPVGKIVNTIAVIPSQLIYTQSFLIPAGAAEHLAEAIDLNLQTISPSRIDETYYDWQEIKENPEAGHLDLLGAFANAGAINEYLSALIEAGFNPVSIEFPGLALARLIKQRWQDLEKDENYLVVFINTEGVLTVILKNGNLSFHHFSPWKQVFDEASAGTAQFQEVKELLIQEFQRVLNYYLGRSGKGIKKAILVSPYFNYEIVEIAEKNFSLEMKNLAADQIPGLTPGSFIALGAALRGLIKRSSDTEISLTATNAQNEYYQGRTLTFASIWRNIIIGSLIFLMIMFTSVDIIISKQQQQLKTRALTELSAQDATEIKGLKDKAQQFNNLLGLVAKAGTQEVAWSPFLNKLITVAGAGITLDRISADRQSLAVSVTGRAINELSAIGFKNRLIKEKNITNVSLPLSNISTGKDGSVSFSLTFKLTSLEF
jgi:hypothetical protein